MIKYTVMTRSFASFSFGCRVNQSEKEALDRKLIFLGYKYSLENPSYYIINTCAVTQKAEREARQFIYQARRKFPKTKILILGCAATLWLSQEKNFDKDILVIPNKDKEHLAKFLSKEENKSLLSSLDLRRVSKSLKFGDKYINSGRYLLKIQDGCQRFCSFCIVPFLRGKPKSKKISEIIQEIKLSGKDIKEVILTAVNTEAFGIDSGEKYVKLLERVIKETNFPRISLGSVNPWSINNEFIKFYENVSPSNRLVKFFHIPIQSGSNKILDLMKRDYTKEEIKEKILAITKINPLSFIATDIIVGFLGEEEKDFLETYKLLEESPISRFHIFRYSIRPKTAANLLAKNMKDPNFQTKVKRAKILFELGRKKYSVFLEKHVGDNFLALFLKNKKNNFQEALLDNQIPVLIKTEKDYTGEVKEIKIDNIKEGKLFGRIV